MLKFRVYSIFVVHKITTSYQSVLLLVEIVSFFHCNPVHSNTSPDSAELLIFIRFPDLDALWRKLSEVELSLVILGFRVQFIKAIYILNNIWVLLCSTRIFLPLSFQSPRCKYPWVCLFRAESNRRDAIAVPCQLLVIQVEYYSPSVWESVNELVEKSSGKEICILSERYRNTL